MADLINKDVLGARIEDPEEELFMLYSSRSSYHERENDALETIVMSDQSHGSRLGLIDQRHDNVSLVFTYGNLGSDGARSRTGKKKKSEKYTTRTVDISLAQDITALRTRAGDTGGGVWRGSVLLSQAILSQIDIRSTNTVFCRDRLSSSRVLELGGGTGLLALILSSLVRSYTCTDLPELVPLIKKNVVLNQHVVPNCDERLFVEALNWNDLHECPPFSRRRLFSHISQHGAKGGEGGGDETDVHPFDLILAVDCVYNPSLLPPLLATIDHFTTPERTITVIVMELRDEDVVREFLSQWLALPGWEVRRIGNDEHRPLLDERFVVWMGLKKDITRSS